jgi:hypothetical protein
MSINTAIQNVGEYFSSHYLADTSGFSKDINDQVKRWKEQGSQSSPRKLQALGDAFFAAKSKALDYPQPELRNKANEKELDRWHPLLLSALGYQTESVNIELATEKKQIPALLRLNRHSQPWLTIFQTPFCINSGDLLEEALEEFVEPVQQQDTNNTIDDLPTLITSWEQAIALLFTQEDQPRWVMLLAGSKIYLFDEHTYAQGRYIYIDLDNAYSNKDNKTFEAIAALLSHDSLAPETESEEVLHEKLREGSIKSTHGVSEQLQSAVREAIELIANGWIEQRRQKGLGYRNLSDREAPLEDGSREVTANQLKHDALVFVYRILFCLYAEARGGELGVLPITDDVYRLGYSLEALRDLADKGQPGTQTEDGSYYAEHLNRLFQLVHEGFHPEEADTDSSTDDNSSSWAFSFPEQNDLFGGGAKQLNLDSAGRKQLDTGNAKTFVIQPLTATLFAPKATPLLNRVHLSNLVLYQVIRRLSLGTGKQGRQIGRINYAELGIVQLGSVYEGLLSYQGFFAKEDLIQVVQAEKKKKVKGVMVQPLVYDDAVDPKKPSWFVAKTREEDFNEGEIVIESRTQQARIYKTGEFILHLNGVDRVNSASYYTPEVLTRALVKEALKERLKDFGPEQADETLRLKICEPAMGSAAFLVEAIDQLARHYLTLKQEQLGESIDPSAFEEELGRVKHYIAVHNVYGVDLNSTAVELGALSLWLASIHSLKIKNGENGSPDIYRPGQTPWFGLRLRAGNSLIGARRAVWTYDQLATGNHYGKKAQAPRQLKPGEQRGEKEIYHFLVWDEDMAPAARDRLMKSHWKEDCDVINDWQRKQVKQKWKPEDLAKGRDICKRVDELWDEYAKSRTKGLEQTECTASVWPIPAGSTAALKPGPTLDFQENLKANLEAQSGAFQRLKLLMDSWCSFYFWPLDQSNGLPSRDAWLASAEVLLGCDTLNDKHTRAMLDLTLGVEINIEGLFSESQKQLPDTRKLAESVPWYQVARSVDNTQNFHHWELIFTEILGPKFEGQKNEPNGFDLMFGNPPWMKVTWNDAPLLSEYEPLLGVRDSKSAKYNSERPILLTDEVIKISYRNAFVLVEGASMFLNDRTLYPALAGVQTNLYKNFIERSWDLISTSGKASLLHPPSVFDDPSGPIFRSMYYQRMIKTYHFRNEMNLFSDVGNVAKFTLTIYGVEKSKIQFHAIFNLYHPKTIAECENKVETAPIPLMKNDEGNWDLSGHPLRVLEITNIELKLFSMLFEDHGTPSNQARLPQVHSQPLLKVLEKFSKAQQRLNDLNGQYLATEMFHESNSQRDGIITREDSPSYQPKTADEWVISGPHFYVSNPFNKTPFTNVTSQRAYSEIDLTEIPENYLPKAIYRPGDKNGNMENFYSAIPEWPKPKKPEKDKNGEWQGGFWPIADNESQAWETLLGEPLKRYGVNSSLPGAKTARKFGYFNKWQGDVIKAVDWLLNNNYQTNSDNFSSKFSNAKIIQTLPGEAIKWLPKPLTSKFRYVNRKRAQPANERTLMPSIILKGSTHVNAACYTVCLINEFDALRLSATASSVALDFFVKVTGRSDIIGGVVDALPIVTNPKILDPLLNRYLRLICLIKSYSELFEEYYSFSLLDDDFVIPNRVNINYELPFSEVTSKWSCLTPLRSDIGRRQAQLEIDILVALDLNLSFDEVVQIYSVQFPVMKTYEEADLYDSKGRHLPNTTRKNAGAKELREVLKNHDGVSPVTVSWKIDNGNQTVTKTFYPPFNHVDRIEDYKTAYRVFSERLGMKPNDNKKEIH